MGIIRSVQIIHCGDPCKTVPLLSRLTRHEMSHWQEAVAANTYSAQHAGGEEDSFRTLQDPSAPSTLHHWRAGRVL